MPSKVMKEPRPCSVVDIVEDFLEVFPGLPLDPKFKRQEILVLQLSGTELATAHGPVGKADVNQTALPTA
jgi:hypothetical protein